MFYGCWNHAVTLIRILFVVTSRICLWWLVLKPFNDVYYPFQTIILNNMWIFNNLQCWNHFCVIRYNYLNDLPSLDPELYRQLLFLKVKLSRNFVFYVAGLMSHRTFFTYVTCLIQTFNMVLISEYEWIMCVSNSWELRRVKAP